MQPPRCPTARTVRRGDRLMAENGAREAADEYVVTREGRVKVLVPNPDLYRRQDGAYEPAWAPVFYNPRMRHNRDIAVLFAKAYAEVRGLRELVVVEPLAGSGVRGIRYAVEANAWVVVNDVDPAAASLARRNIELNRVEDRTMLTNMDANELLASLRRRGIVPSIVDLDPFGSPAPFLDEAIRSIRVRGVIAVTATDTAPLCGSHLKALRRRYDVVPARTLWEKEQAVRILAGYIIRRAASHEYGANILLGYYRDYYVRLYVELVRGAGRADRSLAGLAYGASCGACGYTGYRDTLREARCPYCGSPLALVGPLYRGPLCDKQLLDTMIEHSKSMEQFLATGGEATGFLLALRKECGILRPYYRVDRVCSFHGLNMPSPGRVAQWLEEHGYPAAWTLYDKRGVKTEAPYHKLVEAVRATSPGGRAEPP